jgi:hypothetical protein
MSYLSDYLKFNHGNECPENFHIWSALCLASAVVSRKVYIDWGQRREYPNLYVCLVGRQGMRKSTAMGIARDILEDHFSSVPLAADVSSSQGISKWLSSDDCLRAFTDENGVTVETHPGAFFINELKHFLGINPQNMLEYLTDMYDKKSFKSMYKNSTSETYPNPYVVILACETPDWILSRLKMEMISGGFARRLIPIFERTKRTSIPRPFITAEMMDLRASVINLLQSVKDIVGPFVWDPDAQVFYDSYYNALQKSVPDDALMEGFHSSKHTQVLKVAMLLSLLEYKKLRLSTEMLQLSISLVDLIEPGITELYKGTGRNDLAMPTARMLAWIEQKGGKVSVKEFRIVAYRDMDYREALNVLEHLKKTEQIIQGPMLVDGVQRELIMLPETYAKIKADSEARSRAADPASTSSSETTSLPPQSSSSGSVPLADL